MANFTATWTAEGIAELKRLWADGVSTPDIAKALGNGLTKNSVISKARRIGLAPHANRRLRVLSPEMRAERRRLIHGMLTEGKPVEEIAATLGVTAKTARKIGSGLGLMMPGADAPRKSIKGTRQGPLRRERPPVPPDAIPFLDTRDATTFRAGRCKFPVDGQDVVSKFLFCGHATSVGTVYCATHNAVAYDQFPVRQQQFAMRR